MVGNLLFRLESERQIFETYTKARSELPLDPEEARARIFDSRRAEAERKPVVEAVQDPSIPGSRLRRFAYDMWASEFWTEDRILTVGVGILGILISVLSMIADG
jgi:hypothetical protein